MCKANFSYESARKSAFNIIDRSIESLKTDYDGEFAEFFFSRLGGQLSILELCGLISRDEYDAYYERILEAFYSGL